MGRAPVVMVVGAAGVGKTRMAVDLGHEHAATVIAPARAAAVDARPCGRSTSGYDPRIRPFAH